jgi:hypothetical protein
MTSRLVVFALGVAAVATVGIPAIPKARAAEASHAVFQVTEKFRHAEGFIRLLERSGVTVQQVTGSMLESMFQGEQRGAFVQTALGVAEIVILPGEMDAERIRILYTRNASTVVPHHYRLDGPMMRRQGRDMDAGYPLYFTCTGTGSS